MTIYDIQNAQKMPIWKQRIIECRSSGKSVKEWCKEHGMDIEDLQKKGQEYGILWQDGRAFHGPCHIRMNLALPTAYIHEAFERLDQYVFNA